MAPLLQLPMVMGMSLQAKQFIVDVHSQHIYM